MRTILTMAALAACGTDSDVPVAPHSEVDCGSSWDGSVETCEAACEEVPELQSPSCAATPNLTCERTFVTDGLRGCCLSLYNPNGPRVIRFYECP